jgi:hypothetical protein
MNFIDFLLALVEDPITYSLIFFIYVILAAIILPIPVEIGLFNTNINPLWLIFILAIGKGIGAMIAFEVGTRIRGGLKKRSYKISFMKKIVNWCEQFVGKYGYYGLFIIMSTPLMIDSATLYLFSLLNPKEKKVAMTRKWFIVINIAAGATRGIIIFLVAYIFSIRLV